VIEAGWLAGKFAPRATQPFCSGTKWRAAGSADGGLRPYPYPLPAIRNLPPWLGYGRAILLQGDRANQRDWLLVQRNPKPQAYLLELPDPSFVQPKDPVLSALLLEVRLKLVPCAEVFAAVGTGDGRIPDGMCRDTESNRMAIGTFEQVVQVLMGHGNQNSAPSRVKASKAAAGQ